MSARDLFVAFYRIARMRDAAGSSHGSDAEIWEAEFGANGAAFQAGFTNYQILMARNAALLAIVDRKMAHREPSKNSVAIQLSVHTFGRVTRGRG